jgi:hypothetical protein
MREVALPPGRPENSGTASDLPAPASRDIEPVPAGPLPEQPIEELIVTAKGLTGYWRFSTSRDIDVDVGVFSGIKIRYGSAQIDRNICWVQEINTGSFTVYCAVSGSPPREVRGSVTEEEISFRSWIGPATVTYSGQFTDSDHVSGGVRGGVLGLNITGQVPASLSRLDAPTVSAPPSESLIHRAWAEIGQNRFAKENYEQALLPRLAEAIPGTLKGQELVKLTYLGQILAPGRSGQPDAAQDVFQLETEAGRGLCRIGVSNRGSLSDIACIALPG